MNYWPATLMPMLVGFAITNQNRFTIPPFTLGGLGKDEVTNPRTVCLALGVIVV